MAASHKVAHAARRGPSIVKEIVYGITLSVSAGLMWNVHHWNTQRRTKEFYDLLERGEISVVVEDE
ncbi:putative cytochrome c oxidase subunit 5C-4 [Syzygium oleosum]|uniref:putative cytochrome c oxidase subunit 5C-4 n=1 Tax=Syzygium oleosum TaxID=219896 RepID=UPI0011D18BF3|nr:putative cytochrome c oxidase subunit 5C-4 [Syzygium oleosum]